MVKNPEILKNFEEEYIKNDKRTPLERIKKYDEMYNFAILSGAIPKKNPLEGIEEKIKLAKILNGVK
ncbi:MAG: hypothetical protein J0M18_20620 [Ignavibacteria bacterium]|nr:hypothetical protein [Ignavibacteria bacterium]